MCQRLQITPARYKLRTSERRSTALRAC
jgi:hypothetical protein